MHQPEAHKHHKVKLKPKPNGILQPKNLKYLNVLSKNLVRTLHVHTVLLKLSALVSAYSHHIRNCFGMAELAEWSVIAICTIKLSLYMQR